MGVAQSSKLDFFWPSKGDIQMWLFQQLKAVFENDPKSSTHNNDSNSSNIIPYQLVWQSKQGTIQFVATRMKDGVKLKFNVDQQTGKILKCEQPTIAGQENFLTEDLNPYIMWKCWVEIWRGQQKCNSLILNKTDSIENASYDNLIQNVKNPIVKITRHRKDQIQVLARELQYTNCDDNNKNRKYQITMQFAKVMIWIFNWDSKNKINPEQYVSEYLTKLNTESPSIYQNTLN